MPYVSTADVDGKKPKQQAQDDSQKNDSKRIHADRIIFILIILGIISLFGSIILGIVLVQGLGWLVDLILEKINADTLGMDNYVPDFLGGAVGLTVGFILDKICIEKINNIFHYKALMRVIMHEFNNIDKAAEENIRIAKENIRIANEKKRRRFKYINEFICDDVSTSAETISVIANIPFAKSRTLSLIDMINLIHNGIKRHNKLVGENGDIADIKTNLENLRCYIRTIKTMEGDRVND